MVLKWDMDEGEGNEEGVWWQCNITNHEHREQFMHWIWPILAI